MATVVKINGVDKTSVTRDVSAQWNTSGRTTARAQMFDVNSGAWRPQVGQEFTVEVDSVVAFGGSIDDVKEAWPGSTVLYYEVLIAGWELLLDKDITNPLLFGKNFFTTNSVSDVLTFESGTVPFNNGYPIRLRTAGTLPAGLSANTTYYVINRDVAGVGKCQLSTSVGGSAVNFTNDGTGDHWAIWMTGSAVRSIVIAYGQPEGVQLGTIRDGVPIEGSLIQWATALKAIDSLTSMTEEYVSNVDAQKTFNFVPRTEFTAPFDVSASESRVLFANLNKRTTREEKANRVYVRVSPDAWPNTVTSFYGDGAKRKFYLGVAIASLSSIVVQGLGVQTVGSYGETGSQWYITPDDGWIIQDPGETVLTSAQQVYVTYKPVGYDAAFAEDAADQASVASQEPGTSGVYAMVRQDVGITSVSAGQAVAASLLARYKTLPKEFSYETRAPGLLPGQLQNINVPLFDLNEDFLINEVSAAMDPDRNWRYRVKCISTTRLASYVQLFEAMLAGGSGASGGVATGGGGGGASIVDPENVEPI